MKSMMLAAALVIAAMAFDLRPVRAAEAPWCAVISLGTDDVYWDCRYRSAEECGPNVLAGNRGTCNQNPRWEGWDRSAEPRRHRKRDARKH